MAVISALSDVDLWTKLLHIRAEGHKSDKIDLSSTHVLRKIFPQFGLNPKQRSQVKPPYPSLVIGTGSRVAPYTRRIAATSKGQTLSVQILKPKSKVSDYDLVVVPEHDELSGNNVLSTLGSPVHFPSDKVDEARLTFSDLADARRKSVLVCLGGNSKKFRFTMADAQQLLQKVEKLAFQDNWFIRITTSRRTPSEISVFFRLKAKEHGWAFWGGPQDGRNPFLAWLVYSQAAIITNDSANMLSEAAWFGLPIHVWPITGKSPKMLNLSNALIKHGAARNFDFHSLDEWTYTPIREGQRVAKHLTELILERYPIPKK